jgi:hypothetical protein
LLRVYQGRPGPGGQGPHPFLLLFELLEDEELPLDELPLEELLLEELLLDELLLDELLLDELLLDELLLEELLLEELLLDELLLEDALLELLPELLGELLPELLPLLDWLLEGEPDELEPLLSLSVVGKRGLTRGSPTVNEAVRAESPTAEPPYSSKWRTPRFAVVGAYMRSWLSDSAYRTSQPAGYSLDASVLP